MKTALQTLSACISILTLASCSKLVSISQHQNLKFASGAFSSDYEIMQGVICCQGAVSNGFLGLTTKLSTELKEHLKIELKN